MAQFTLSPTNPSLPGRMPCAPTLFFVLLSTHMQKSLLKYLSLLLGAFFLILAVYYWMTPANMLAHFVPGYDASMTTIHLKHGIGSLCIGLALFAFAWFQGGKKTAATSGSTDAQQHQGPQTK